GVTDSVANKAGKVRYQVQALPKIEGGKVVRTDTSLKIIGADVATIYVSIATNVINYHDISGNETKKATHYLKEAVERGYEHVKADHIRTYKKYFDRVSLHLGHSNESGKPTNLRIQDYPKAYDPSLAALYFQ